MPSPLEALLVAMLEAGHRATADGMLDVTRRAAAHVGADIASLYLIDMEQRVLEPVPGSASAEPQAVDRTLAGRAYRAVTTIEAGEDGAKRLYIPMLDGAARLGVLEARVGDDAGEARRACELLAKLLAELLVTKQRYGDLVPRTRRRKEMRLAAEIQWELLPPLTFQTPAVTVSGILEPSYEIGGDAFDYAVNTETVHVMLVDAMGHGLDSSLIASLTVGAYRNRRRGGHDLAGTYAAMDAVVSERFGPERFATAQLAELDCLTGRLDWINAGHPAPLLVRDARVVGRLEQPPVLPLGFGEGAADVARVQLQPGDSVLWFTDGVVEARGPTGEFFGDDRLVELLTKALHSGEPIPEVLRRLTHAVLDHHAGQLRDDATMLFLDWRGTQT